jgi:hypothetical protein
MMTLNQEEIRAALKGCVAIVAGQEALRFQRMPAATLAWYRNSSDRALMVYSDFNCRDAEGRLRKTILVRVIEMSIG